MTIVEFLEARLAEDEAVVRPIVDDFGGDDDGPVDERLAGHVTIGAVRVLREVEAKRAILAGPDAFVPERWRTWVLCHLASVYADHPDFDQAWGLTRVV